MENVEEPERSHGIHGRRKRGRPTKQEIHQRQPQTTNDLIFSVATLGNPTNRNAKRSRQKRNITQFFHNDYDENGNCSHVHTSILKIVLIT